MGSLKLTEAGFLTASRLIWQTEKCKSIKPTVVVRTTALADIEKLAD